MFNNPPSDVFVCLSSTESPPKKMCFRNLGFKTFIAKICPLLLN